MHLCGAPLCGAPLCAVTFFNSFACNTVTASPISNMINSLEIPEIKNLQPNCADITFSSHGKTKVKTRGCIMMVMASEAIHVYVRQSAR